MMASEMGISFGVRQRMVIDRRLRTLRDCMEKKQVVGSMAGRGSGKEGGERKRRKKKQVVAGKKTRFTCCSRSVTCWYQFWQK